MCKGKSVSYWLCVCVSAMRTCVSVCVHMWLQNIIWNIAHAVVVVPMIKNKRLFACCIRLHSVSHPLSVLSLALPRWQPKRRRDQQQPKQLIHTHTRKHREGICHTHTHTHTRKTTFIVPKTNSHSFSFVSYSLLLFRFYHFAYLLFVFVFTRLLAAAPATIECHSRQPDAPTICYCSRIVTAAIPACKGVT